MSDQMLAFLLALAILLFLVGWVPFLDLLQRVIRNHREAAEAALRSLRISRRRRHVTATVIPGCARRSLAPARLDPEPARRTPKSALIRQG
jgi:hypothetical protein